MSGNKKNKKNKVGTLYILAFFWLFWGIGFDFYKVSHIVICAIISLFIIKLSKALFGGKKDEQQEKDPTQFERPVMNAIPEPAKFSTGDEELDKMIDDKDKAIEEMHRLNDAIPDPKVSEQISHLEIVTTKIVKYVMEHPEKKVQVRRFFNYYLPTTLKLLNAYDRMDDVGVSGTNIDGTMGKVETMMDTAVAAFDRQLDSLFADEAMDISTDITVMENLLKSEGLVDDGITEEAIMKMEDFPDALTIDDVLSNSSKFEEAANAVINK